MKILSTIKSFLFADEGVQEPEPEPIVENLYEIQYLNSGSSGGKYKMSEIAEKVRNGKITRGNVTAAVSIIVPYTDPVDGNTYDLPFMYGTVQTFEKEDGTTFTGLGLMTRYCIPNADVHFDAEETNNTENARRQQYGSNRWMHSGVRQWLNKSGLNWWTPQHEYDREHYKPVPKTVKGLLSCLPEDFVRACVPVKMSTKTSSVDGGGYDITYDKFFLLSMSQINIKITSSCGVKDESEGRYWELPRSEQGYSGYISSDYGNKKELVANSSRVKERVGSRTKCGYWTRSAYLSPVSNVWLVDSSGMVNGQYARYPLSNGVIAACVIG